MPKFEQTPGASSESDAEKAQETEEKSTAEIAEQMRELSTEKGETEEERREKIDEIKADLDKEAEGEKQPLSYEQAQKALEGLADDYSISVDGIPTNMPEAEHFRSSLAEGTWNANQGVLIFNHNGETLATPYTHEKARVMREAGYQKDESAGVPGLNNPDYYARGDRGESSVQEQWNSLLDKDHIFPSLISDLQQ